jgi:uncharacterized protein (DUF2235 family)
MKRIVICCDGTWNDRSKRATNVAKLVQMVTPLGQTAGGETIAQLAYYDPGVGTERSWLAKLTGGAFGEGLSANVLEAYRFIIDNYNEDDELYLFGFSRGAFTVRSLSGLIRKCGILRKEHSPLAQRAYELYRARSETPDDRRSWNGVDGEPVLSFRQEHSSFPVPLHFIGVWDTVGSIGIPAGPANPLYYFAQRKWGFHDLDLSTRVRFAYQALAIDERRGAFRPAIWNVQQTPPGVTQTVEQRWFPGVHSDIGGGYLETGLSDTVLRWMAERAVAAGLTVAASYEDGQPGIRVRPDPVDTLHDSMTWQYRWLRKYPRPLGHEDGQQLSFAARRRQASTVTVYEPANLRRYLAQRADLEESGAQIEPLPSTDY